MSNSNVASIFIHSIVIIAQMEGSGVVNIFVDGADGTKGQNGGDGGKGGKGASVS